MRLLIQACGFVLMLLGIYFLGRNIFFTTQVSPYWWRGLAADASILLLTIGVVWLTIMPRGARHYGWIGVGTGIVLIFLNSRAVLAPTSLWQFFIALTAMVFGYRLLATGRWSW